MTSERRWSLGLAAFVAFTVTLHSLAVVGALGVVRDHFHASVGQLAWTLNAYNLSLGVAGVAGVALADRFGRSRTAAVGLVLLAAASSACALATGVDVLIAARAAQGVGAGLAMQQAWPRRTVQMPPRRYTAFLAAAVGAGALVSPVVGGALGESSSWQWFLGVTVALDLGAAALVLVRMPERADRGSRLDVGGLLLVVGGVLGVLAGLTSAAGRSGWGSPWTLVPFGLGAVLLAVFVRFELPVGGFRIREFLSVRLAAYCLFASLLGATFLLAQYFQAEDGMAPLAAGVRMTPWTAALMVGLPVVGTWADRAVTRRFLIGGLLLAALGLGGMAWAARDDFPYALMVPPMVVGGCGLSLALIGIRASGDRAGCGPTPPRRGVPAAVLAWAVSGVIGVAMMGAVVGRGGGSAVRLERDFAPAIGLTAVLALFGSLAALGVPARPFAGRRPGGGAHVGAAVEDLCEFQQRR